MTKNNDKKKKMSTTTNNNNKKGGKKGRSPQKIKKKSKHIIAGQYRAASETPFKWRFADGPIVARDFLLAEQAYYVFYMARISLQ